MKNHGFLKITFIFSPKSTTMTVGACDFFKWRDGCDQRRHRRSASTSCAVVTGSGSGGDADQAVDVSRIQRDGQPGGPFSPSEQYPKRRPGRHPLQKSAPASG